jgi:hypothetical protein
MKTLKLGDKILIILASAETTVDAEMIAEATGHQVQRCRQALAHLLKKHLVKVGDGACGEKVYTLTDPGMEKAKALQKPSARRRPVKPGDQRGPVPWSKGHADVPLVEIKQGRKPHADQVGTAGGAPRAEIKQGRKPYADQVGTKGGGPLTIAAAARQAAEADVTVYGDLMAVDPADGEVLVAVDYDRNGNVRAYRVCQARLSPDKAKQLLRMLVAVVDL